MKNIKFPRQYSYQSSAYRAIKNYEKKHGKKRFSINQLDEGCFEVNLHEENKTDEHGK